MGKSAPTPPPAPDPNVVSAAQTKSNVATALNQSQLNNGNSYGPTGSVTNTYNPSLNQWTQNTQLSPAEQSIFNQGTQAQSSALGIANNQLGNVQSALNQSLTPGTLATGVQGGAIQQGYGQGGPIQYGFNPGQGVQGQIASTPVQFGFDHGNSIQTGLGGSAPVQYGYGNGGQIQQGVQTQGLQNGYDSGGQVQGQVQGAAPIQSGYNTGPGVQYGIGSQNVNQSVQNADNATYNQAVSRLNPQWQQAGEQQNAQLVAQGLNPNDAAWQNSQTLFNNSRNDAYNQAAYSGIQAGNAEQNTLFGQQATQGQFYNSAQAQNAAQAAGQAQFYNSAQGQQYGQNLSSGQFANQAQGQQNSQNANAANFYNNSQLAGFGENLQAGQFGNAAQAQGNSQNAQALAAYNAAQGQQYGQGLSSAQFGNQAAGQQFSQGLQGQQAFNQASGQQFAQGATQGQFANQAGAQQYAQNQGQAAFGNAAQGQANSQNQAAASFGNTAQQQGYSQGMGNAQLYNQAAQQNFQNQAYAQQLPINEFNSLMSSGQVQMPQGYSGAQTQVAPTDVTGAYALQQEALQNTYQAQMQNYQSGLSGLFSLGNAAMAMLPFSDVRLKRDIRPAGKWRGHNVYHFKYLWSDEPQVGVLAQEVARTHPHAIGERAGFMTVNYGAL